MIDDSGPQLNILLLTDVFPPKSGGSGWSTYYLAKALAANGDMVRIVRPRYDLPTRRGAVRTMTVGGLEVEELVMPAAPRWVARIGMARAWRERQAARHLGRRAR